MFNELISLVLESQAETISNFCDADLNERMKNHHPPEMIALVYDLFTLGDIIEKYEMEVQPYEILLA